MGLETQPSPLPGYDWCPPGDYDRDWNLMDNARTPLVWLRGDGRGVWNVYGWKQETHAHYVYWKGARAPRWAWEIRLLIDRDGRLIEALRWESRTRSAAFLPTAGAPPELDETKRFFETLWELEQ